VPVQPGSEPTFVQVFVADETKQPQAAEAMWMWHTIAEEPEEIAYAMAVLVGECRYPALAPGSSAAGRAITRRELLKIGGDKHGGELIRRAERGTETMQEAPALSAYVNRIRAKAVEQVKNKEVGKRPRHRPA
jgi:hypothetical protein